MRALEGRGDKEGKANGKQTVPPGTVCEMNRAVLGEEKAGEGGTQLLKLSLLRT